MNAETQHAVSRRDVRNLLTRAAVLGGVTATVLALAGPAGAVARTAAALPAPQPESCSTTSNWDGDLSSVPHPYIIEDTTCRAVTVSAPTCLVHGRRATCVTRAEERISTDHQVRTLGWCYDCAVQEEQVVERRVTTRVTRHRGTSDAAPVTSARVATSTSRTCTTYEYDGSPFSVRPVVRDC